MGEFFQIQVKFFNVGRQHQIRLVGLVGNNSLLDSLSADLLLGAGFFLVPDVYCSSNYVLGKRSSHP
jgi:hypothetical protein